MSNPIVIIGSGFAAYQLVKNIRKHDPVQQIMVITADSGDEYAKPDLSHVFSKEQSADDLVKMRGDEFATQQGITLLKNSRVEAINAAEKTLLCNGEKIAYHKRMIYQIKQARKLEARHRKRKYANPNYCYPPGKFRRKRKLF